MELGNNCVRSEIIMALMMKISYSGMWRLAYGICQVSVPLLRNGIVPPCQENRRLNVHICMYPSFSKVAVRHFIVS